MSDATADPDGPDDLDEQLSELLSSEHMRKLDIEDVRSDASMVATFWRSLVVEGVDEEAATGITCEWMLHRLSEAAEAEG